MSGLDGVDLDQLSAEDVQRLVDRLRQQHAAREANPELHRGVLRLLEQAMAKGRLSEPKVSEIREALRRSHPCAVVIGFVHDLLGDKPALGAVPRPRRQPIDYDALIRQNPQRQLPVIMREAWLFCRDEDRALETAACVAEAAGVPDDQAEQALEAGLRQLRRAWREKPTRAG